MTRETFGDVDLSRLTRFYDRINQIRPRLDQADAFHKTQPTTTVTARRVDAHQPAGLRPYFASRALIATALDHNDALPHLFQSGHGLTPFAPWTLVRSVFETSVWAIWILEPTASRDRRLRGLRREWLGHQEYRNFEVAALHGAPRTAVRAAKTSWDAVTKIYENEAAGLGLTWSTWKDGGFNMVDEVKKLTSIHHWAAGQEHMLEVLWRSMSGHAHGYSWAIQAGGIVERSDTVPGGVEVTLTINEETLFAHVMGAATLLQHAMDLYIDRSTKPA